MLEISTDFYEVVINDLQRHNKLQITLQICLVIVFGINYLVILIYQSVSGFIADVY